MERQSYIDKIIERLSFLKSKVELSTPLNFTDINIHSENFYRDFLNLLYGYKLENINILETNAEAIDLGDEKQKLAFQVTSTSDLSKIRKTVASFIKKKLYEKYETLVIINITKKSKYRVRHVGNENVFQLDTNEDIWDISNIIKDINDLKLDKIKSIYEFLKEQISFAADAILAKEICTFMSLIGYLSDDNHPSAGVGFIEEPDPDGKINKRFADHSEFLKNEYVQLYEEYGQVLQDVMEQSDLGHTRIRRLSLHLKTFSDKVLTEQTGDAQDALTVLVQHYEDLLSVNGAEHDTPSIRFFLVDQLIKCNVFPNKEGYVDG